MSAWEAGYYSLAEYDSWKKFLVTPERLAIEGTYGFICKARSGLNWEAVGFVVRVADREPAYREETPHLVTLAFETDPDMPEKTKTYPFNTAGLVQWPTGPFEEAYLRLYPDGTEEEFNNMQVIAHRPISIGEAASVTPVGVR